MIEFLRNIFSYVVFFALLPIVLILRLIIKEPEAGVEYENYL